MRYCILLFWLSCLSFLPAQLRAATPPEPFSVTIKTAATQVSRNKTFPVELRVVNTSATAQTIHTMSCSWDENWKSSNPHVLWQGWACKRNVALVFKLKPGKAYIKMLPMYVQAADPATHQVRFKMGFMPGRGKTTYWSNVISLRLRRKG